MEAGADVIIGGHPHVIEPVEVLTAPDGHKVPCFWSVGNFVSTQVDNQNLIGGVAKVTMVKDGNGACSVTACSFVPTVTHKGIGSNMTTYLLRDYTDDLATSNYLEANGTDNTNLTVAWANEFCTEVLGPGFDTTSEQLVIDPAELVASAPSTTDATGSSEAEADASAEEDAEELDEAA
jgi:poly-gamma-glutamate synthesis protein (capsule biosynthesis protein)